MHLPPGATLQRRHFYQKQLLFYDIIYEKHVKIPWYERKIPENTIMKPETTILWDENMWKTMEITWKDYDMTINTVRGNNILPCLQSNNLLPCICVTLE